MVLMEAMASGVPVVASRISGIPELVEDGVSSLLVPPGEPAALAQAPTRVLRRSSQPGFLVGIMTHSFGQTCRSAAPSAHSLEPIIRPPKVSRWQPTRRDQR